MPTLAWSASTATASISSPIPPSDDLVTVHVYAPALMELNLYSTTSAVVERRRLRYTVADDLDEISAAMRETGAGSEPDGPRR